MDDKIIKEKKYGWLKTRREEKRVKAEQRWVLSIWSPSAFELNVLIWLSPIHLYLLWNLNLDNFLDLMIPIFGSLIMMSYFVYLFHEKIRDEKILSGQVLNEFTQGFVYKLSPFRVKNDKSIQCDLLADDEGDE